MTEDRWVAVDSFFEDSLAKPDIILSQALADATEAGIPAINVSANQGQLLALLVQIHGARRILEIGTLAGYSTIWLARSLPDDGQLVTLELDPLHARVASMNIERAGLANKVDIRTGKAVDSLAAMVEAGEEPFDFIFIDADKPSNPAYLDFSIKLARPGTVIFLDNVVRNGAVANPDSNDPNVMGVRAATEAIAHNPRLTATAIQTVGNKGYDGFALIRVS